MLSRLKNFFKPELKTLNTIFISKEKILHNLEKIKKRQPDSAFFPVFKSNAYGHGILQMLEILKGQNFPYLAVDSFPEYQLIHKHSNFNILMIWETLPENYRFFDHKRTTFAVYNFSTLQALAKLKKRITIHLFLNTGMNREGIQIEHLGAFLELLRQEKQIQVEGVMSHFHSSSLESMQSQIKRFKEMTSIIEKYWFPLKWKHISASSGIFLMNDPFFTACRPGIAMYGYSPYNQENEELWLQPALRLESTIVSLQSLSPWDGVSYNQKRKTDQACKVATVPFGYYEWWIRSASGKLVYRYEGKELPQLGTICMNLSSCLADEMMKIGDPIELISDQVWAPNSVDRIAKDIETIPYEVLIRLDKGIRRTVV